MHRAKALAREKDSAQQLVDKGVARLLTNALEESEDEGEQPIYNRNLSCLESIPYKCPPLAVNCTGLPIWPSMIPTGNL